MIIKNNLFLTADNCPKCNNKFSYNAMHVFFCKDCKIQIMCGVANKCLSFTILNVGYTVYINWSFTPNMNFNYIGYCIRHNNINIDTGIEFYSYKEIINYIEKYANNIALL